MTDTTAAPLSASVRLHTALRPWHDALEATPFAHALLSGTLPLDRYIGQLTAYHGILGALEEELSRSNSPTVTAVYDDTLAKLPLIERDLRHFAQPGVRTTEPGVPQLGIRTAEPAVRAFVADIHRTATTAPPELLGFLYVLEGSTMGALYLLRFVRDTFALTAGTDGVAYYASGDRERWRRLIARLDAALPDADAQDQVLAAAERAYRHTAAVTEALSTGLLPHAS
ncbi:biliverdin-producing heme oxygenase [Streptomyces sp. YIM S03343]